MSITDELRKVAAKTECANGRCEKLYRGDLEHIADRIDAEMVELPKSADGKIWTGREVCFWTGSEDEDYHKFHSLTYTDGRWCVEDSNWQRYPAVSVWYERPDSFERIAEELDEMADSEHTEDDMCEKLAGIADRIRKLGIEVDG